MNRSFLRLLFAIVGLSLLLGACAPSIYGPWRDGAGEIVSNASILEFRGLNRCDQSDVTFFRFFDRQYAKDPKGVLGELTSPVSGEVLTFDNRSPLPTTAEPTTFTHRNRVIWVDDATLEDYLYIVIDGQVVERWPRAEATCVEE